MIHEVFQMLHTHVFLVAPLGACDMAQVGANQHQRGIAVGKGSNHTGSPPDLSVQTLNDVVGADLYPVFRREVVIGQCLLNANMRSLLLTKVGRASKSDFMIRKHSSICQRCLFTLVIVEKSPCQPHLHGEIASP